MTRALICHGPWDFEEIDMAKATPEQVELAILSTAELELVVVLMKLEDKTDELE